MSISTKTMATQDGCAPSVKCAVLFDFYTFKANQLRAGIGLRKWSEEWCRKFDAGCIEIYDLLWSGRPNTAVNFDSITAICGLIQENCHITEEEIWRSLVDKNCIEVSHGTVHSIVHKILEYRKVSVRWVPKALTEEHRMNRMGAALTFLTQYHWEEGKFLSRIVIWDEAWVHHFQPESKQQSMLRSEKGGKASKKFKQVDSASKVMLTLFWDSKGVLLEEYLPPGWTVNADVYCETLFKLRRAIQNKRRGKLSKGIVFCTIMRIPTQSFSHRFSSTIFSGTYSRIRPTLWIWRYLISMHFPPFNVILQENGKPLFGRSRTVCIHSSQSRRHRPMLKASQNSSHDTRNVLNVSATTSKNRAQPNLSSYVNFWNQLYFFLH